MSAKSAAAEVVGAATTAAQPLLIAFDELPAWLQDNHYILTGYRRPQYSWSGCARSVFGYLHNETVNIQTHLLGALVSLYLLFNVQNTLAGYTTVTWHDSVGLSLALLAGVFCLGASALFHAADCHSPNVSKRCLRLDYSGIIVLTVGTFYPGLHYGFFCHYHLQVIYAIGITVAGALAAYVVLNPHYTPAYHRARALVFSALGFCAVVPLVHHYLIYGSEIMLEPDTGFAWLALGLCLYLAGAMIYACRIPERWMPVTFDYFGASHQILHVCVLLAVLSHYKAILTALEHWHGQHQADVCDF